MTLLWRSVLRQRFVLEVALFELTVLHYLPIQVIAIRRELNPSIWEDAISEKITRLVSTALLLILFFTGVPMIAANQHRGPPQEMLENLNKQLNLSGDQKNQLKAIPDRDID